MLSVFCYTEFAVEIPVAGGSFAYLRVELGDVAAFIAAANLILESIIGTAAVARSWTSYFASLINKPASALRIQTSLLEGYNELDPIAVVVIAVTATMAILSAKGTSRINWVASAIHVVVIAFVIVAGFIHAKPSNLTPFMPNGVPGVFHAAAIVYFAYGGFDNIATMAEEVKNPSRDIPLGLLGSMSVITVIYCVMALVLSMMQPYTAIDRSAAYSVAFSSVGMHWAHLDVLSSLLSVSTLFIFMMMATALLVRRYYVRGVTTRTHALRLLVFLLVIIASSAGIAAYWGTRPDRWEGYVVLVPAWLLGTLGIQVMVPAARAPKVWGVPLVPWLPSLSIATNLFLMGSLGSQAFVRFGACTAIMLIYYVLVGLHATYDVAHDVCSEDELKDYGDTADDDAGEKAAAKTADVEKASAGEGGR
uniref:Putative amino acid permease yfnA n=1 Tax=Aegilops tauschii TaxID=37682 RepID=M8CCJ4_AEGTA